MFLILPLLLHRCHRSKTQQKADENCMFPALDLHDRFTNSRLTTGRRGDWTTMVIIGEEVVKALQTSSGSGLW